MFENMWTSINRNEHQSKNNTKTAPIKREVEVISVTPDTISEFVIQNELIGISKAPIKIERLVAFW